MAPESPTHLVVISSPVRLSPLRRHALAAQASFFAATACSDSPAAPTSGPAAFVDVVAGDDQTGTVGAQLPLPVIVFVTDAEDRPVRNQAVTFAVMSGGGSVDQASAVTDEFGLAQVRWTLGTTVETEHRLEARAVRGNGSTLASTPVRAFAEPGPPASLNTVNWNGAGMSERMVVPIPVSVRVVDQYGNPIHGIPVTFAVTAGGGTLTGGTTTSGGFGIATLGSWTLGAAGTNTVTATSGALPPATFTTNARSTTPARVVLSSGQDQTAAVTNSVPLPLSVIVQNAAGEPLSGVTVTFTPGPNSGNVHIPTATTGPTGIATLNGWFLGNTVGPQTLVASASPTATFTFTAIATSGNAFQLVKRSGDAQVALPGQTLPVAPSVFVRDAYGNAVAGTTVTFAVYNGNGTVTGATAVSDAAGIATVGGWTLGPLTGVQTLRASAPGVALDVDFTATANSSNAVQLLLHQQTPTSARFGETITISVTAVDAAGLGKAGVTVNFAPIPSNFGAGTVTDPVQVTNAQGVASVRYTMPTNVYAIAGVDASSSGLATLRVNVDGVVGPAARIIASLPTNNVVAGADLGRPTFSVVDDRDIAIPFFPVTFTVTAGDGTVDGATQVQVMTASPPSTATGPLWKSGPVAGTNTLVISTPSAPSVQSVTLTRTTMSPP